MVNAKVKDGVLEDGFVKNYNSSTDKIYSLDDKNSDGYKAVAEMLKKHYPDGQIDGLLEKAFFIRNSAGTQSVKKNRLNHRKRNRNIQLCSSSDNGPVLPLRFRR